MCFYHFLQTEQIRRANRLWASDSLFLREYLLIPVPTDSPLSTSNAVVNYNCNSISESFDSVNVRFSQSIIVYLIIYTNFMNIYKTFVSIFRLLVHHQ